MGISELTFQDAEYLEHVRETAEKVAVDVQSDIDYQTNKFGPQRLTTHSWVCVIVEEFGETVQAYMQGDLDGCISEAKQTIACLARLINEVEREKEGLNVEEEALYGKPV